jgi:SAM-dependent methyltransferase
VSKCNLCNYQGPCKTVSTEIREGDGLIVMCPECSHIFQDINMSASELEDYYNIGYLETNSLIDHEVLEAETHCKERLKTLDKGLEYLLPYLNPEMAVLDIGAGAGSLLYAIRDKVRTCHATELNQAYVSYMNSLGFKAYYGFAEKLEISDKFDLVISLNALDHMPEPLPVLKKIHSLLKDNGLIYLELPNRNEALNFYLPEENRKNFNKFFWHKAHYSYFYEDTIIKALKLSGFTDIKVDYRHEYTIINYLNWYFLGKPQKEFVDATTNTRLFNGDSQFERAMNELISVTNQEFLNIMKRTKRGDTMICTAVKNI